MGVTVHLQCYHAGEPAGLPRSSLRALFPVGPDSEPDRWRVRYDDRNSCDIILLPHPSDPELVRALSVDRPCRDGRLWDALLGVLRLGPVVLYALAETPPLIADAAVAPHLPADLVEALGLPRCVGTGAEIRRAVEGG